MFEKRVGKGFFGATLAATMTFAACSDDGGSEPGSSAGQSGSAGAGGSDASGGKGGSTGGKGGSTAGSSGAAGKGGTSSSGGSGGSDSDGEPAEKSAARVEAAATAKVAPAAKRTS